jgi:hypothetical protein
MGIELIIFQTITSEEINVHGGISGRERERERDRERERVLI